MNNFLIDTDILSFYLKGDNKVMKNFRNFLFKDGFRGINISEITYFEILAGLEYKNAEKQKDLFEQFISKCNIVKLSVSSIRLSAIQYGKLRRNGILIGTPDLLIAGIAMINDFVLVTNNQKHFKPIEDLLTTNWLK